MHVRASSTGQSLVEVLIITVLVASILTAIAGVVSKSLQSTAENKRKSIAANFAQEGVEVFRKNRQILGWETFQSSLDSGTYCLDSLPANEEAFTGMLASACSGGQTIPGTIFTREVEVTSNATEVDVEVSVRWDVGEYQEVTISQKFRDILN
jgi:Tfp pilus assembly protein PilV